MLLRAPRTPRVAHSWNRRAEPVDGWTTGSAKVLSIGPSEVEQSYLLDACTRPEPVSCNSNAIRAARTTPPSQNDPACWKCATGLPIESV
jgi:hypothetical protein